MRILALVTDAFGGYGGIAEYNQELFRAWAYMPEISNIEVLARGADERNPPTPSGVVQRRPIMSRLAYALAAVRAALSRPDVVFNGHLFHGPLALFIARICGAKLVSQLHGTEVWSDMKPAHRFALERSDLVLCVSRDTRDRILAQSQGLAARTRVVPNSVGRAYRPGDREAARAHFGVGDKLVVLTVGRLDGRGGYKGHDRVIPLIAELVAAGESLVYLIAGVGPDRCRLQTLAAEYGVDDVVRFLGKVSAEELPVLYRAADLFAMPSTGEGFGIVYLEAMASGTPAIGLDVGGVADALDDGQLGDLVTSEDFPLAFKEALFRARAMTSEDREDLSARTISAFGTAAFRGRVSAAMGALS